MKLYLGMMTRDLDYNPAASKNRGKPAKLDENRIKDNFRAGAIEIHPAAGEVIIKKNGSIDDAIYIIVKGRCEVKTDLARLAIAYVEEGQLAGESIIYGQPRNAYLVAAEGCVLYKFSKALFLDCNEALAVLDADAAWKSRQDKVRYGELYAILHKLDPIRISSESLIPWLMTPSDIPEARKLAGYPNALDYCATLANLSNLRNAGF